MIIDFKNLPEMVNKNFNGGEKEVSFRAYADDKNRIMYGTLVPGASIGLHTHTEGSEIVYVLQGEATAYCDGKEEKLLPGTAHYCPKGHSHTVINNSKADMIFFSVVIRQ
jgi:quercetin dioxygenase-like cupin family protein